MFLEPEESCGFCADPRMAPHPSQRIRATCEPCQGSGLVPATWIVEVVSKERWTPRATRTVYFRTFFSELRSAHHSKSFALDTGPVGSYNGSAVCMLSWRQIMAEL